MRESARDLPTTFLPPISPALVTRCGGDGAAGGVAGDGGR